MTKISEITSIMKIVLTIMMIKIDNKNEIVVEKIIGIKSSSISTGKKTNSKESKNSLNRDSKNKDYN